MQIPDIPVERSADFATAERVRVLRGRQAWVLMGVAIASILVGLGVMQHPPTAPAARAFGLAVAIQFVVWGAIDAAFAGVGVIMLGQATAAPDPDRFRGTIAILVSAVCYAYNIVLMRQQALVARPAEVAF